MKLLKYWRRLVQLFYHYQKKSTHLPYFPVRLWIELASHCNLQCVMCPNKKLKKEDRGYMDLNLYRKIIDEASSFAFEVNLSHRGESLLHPSLIEAIKYAKGKGLFTRLHTNGSLLTENLSSEILESGLDRLSFSFDGYTAENYEKIRIKGNFEKTLGNIIRFLELKKSSQRKKPHTAIEVIDFSPEKTEKNERAKKEFKERFRELPLDELVVKELHNWAGEIAPEKNSPIRTTCTFPWNALVIYWDGKVLPCTQDFFGCYVLGDASVSPLKEIWNNEKIAGLRKKLSQKKLADFSPCSECDRIRVKTIFGVPREYLWRFITKRMP